MKKFRLLINPLLLIFLVSILTIPFVLSETVVQPVKDLGSVAGFTTVTNKDLAIYPNFSDFDGYVSFVPSRIINGRYSDQLTLTSFRGQIAIYHRLYTVFNDSDSFIALRLALSQLPLTISFDKFVLSLHLGNEPACIGVEDVCHLQEVFVQDGEILNMESQTVMLAPGAEAQITATVVGLADSVISTAPVIFNITLLANFAE